MRGCPEPWSVDHADLRSPEKDEITLRHLLTMSQGLAWDEDLPYSDPRNSEIQMNEAPDPVRYALAQPIQTPAGTVYNYSGGSATIIAALLHKATGETLDSLVSRADLAMYSAKSSGRNRVAIHEDAAAGLLAVNVA